MDSEYLDSLNKQFKYYKILGERTFAQISDQDLFTCISPESNSIAIIVKHLVGNMKSRFTDFLTSDGEKEWRERDREFVNTFSNRMDLLASWEEGWKCTFEALDSVSDIQQLVYIRNEAHTVYEALNRQLAHYAYHMGQIVFLGRTFKGADWKSLSIPKNQSESYNAEKFSKKKKKGHYTDDFLENQESKLKEN